MRRIAQSMTLLRQRAGGNELPDVEAGHRVCAAPCNRAGTSLYAAPTFSICSAMDSACFRLASDQMIHPLSPEQRHEVLGSINLLDQPLRGSNGLPTSGAVAFGERQCRPARGLQIEFLLPPPAVDSFVRRRLLRIMSGLRCQIQSDQPNPAAANVCAPTAATGPRLPQGGKQLLVCRASQVG